MATSHAESLCFLFISLFFLPAWGVTKFYPCNPARVYPVKISAVEISPHPVKRSGNANITITAYTSKAIPDGVSVNLNLAVAMYPTYKKSYSLCDITSCPVAPGPFVLTFSNVFTEREKKNAVRYIVSVIIAEKNQKEQMMCVMFNCQFARGYASLLSQVTE